VKILNRYVLKEHVGPLVFALSALTSLLLLNYIARQFANLVGKGLPWSVIVEFLLLSVPFTVAMTLPMAVLVSTLYAFSRLASENEVTAMKASGVGLAKLLIPVMVGGAVLALVMIGFNDQVLPRANHRLSTLQRDIAAVKPTFALKEQVINEVSKGRLALRTARIDRARNRMHDVTIYDYQNPAIRRTIYADSGDMTFASNGKDLQLLLYDGEMHEVAQEDKARFQRLFFRTDMIRVAGVANSLERSEEGGYRSDRERTICDMQGELAAAERDVGLARSRMADILVRAAVREATGVDGDTVIAPVDTQPSWGLARIYCTALAVVDSSAAAGSPPRSPSSGILLGTAALSSEGRSLPDFEGIESELEALRSTIEQRIGERNAFDVEIQKKFSIAVACVVFILIGAPVALRFPRGGVGLVIGVSLAVFALYYVGLIAGEDLADENIIPPALAMWGTNIVLAVIGLVLLTRMGREGSTARGGDLRELVDSMRAWFAIQGRRLGMPADRRRHNA
jgi:lipopolysaccharide export system permease protein